MDFLVSNFSLSIKLVDKNHIIYNKKAINTQNLLILMKKKFTCKVVDRAEREGKNIANNCKVRNRNNETPKNSVYI